MPLTRRHHNLLPKTGQTATQPTVNYQDGDDGTYQAGFVGTRFTDNGDGTVTDYSTGLTWVKTPHLLIPGTAGLVTENTIQTKKDDWLTTTAYSLGDVVRDATAGEATAMTIEGATDADPCDITVDSIQGIQSTEPVLIAGVVGNMGDDVLNGNIFYAKVIDSTSIELYTNAALTTGVDTTGKTYTSGGTSTQVQFFACIDAHTSGDFGDDIAASKWVATSWIGSAANLTTASFPKWSDALTNCLALTYAGFSDWRMPNIKEMYSLTDFSSASDTLLNVTYFPSALPAGIYWSCTTSGQNSPRAFCVQLVQSGTTMRRAKTDVVRSVWPVRGGRHKELA